MKKSLKELNEIAGNFLKGQDAFVLEEIQRVNFKPHPYTIGAKHVAYASDNNSGMLTDDVCKKIPCAHRGCNLSYEEHTSDCVAFLKLLRNVGKEEAQKILNELLVDVLGKEVDGVAFIETPEKFRIE